MKKTITILLAAALTGIICTAKDGKTVNEPTQKDKITYNMGEEYGRDSSKQSGRSFPKRLVVAKNSFGFGLQGMYLSLDANDAQAFQILTGATGKVKFGNIAPYVSYAYARNNAIGLRLSYTHIGADIDNAVISLLTDDLKFDLSGLNTNTNKFGGEIFNRSWWGLDKKGRFALFADVALGYDYSKAIQSNKTGITHNIQMTFSPGLEIFVMNNLSFHLALCLAKLSYSWGTSYKDGAATGTTSGGDANVRLNLLDLSFGLNFYL